MDDLPHYANACESVNRLTSSSKASDLPAQSNRQVVNARLRVRQGVLELAGETALGLSLLDPFIYSHKVQEIQEKRDAVGHKEQERQE